MQKSTCALTLLISWCELEYHLLYANLNSNVPLEWASNLRSSILFFLGGGGGWGMGVNMKVCRQRKPWHKRTKEQVLKLGLITGLNVATLPFEKTNTKMNQALSPGSVFLLGMSPNSLFLNPEVNVQLSRIPSCYHILGHVQSETSHYLEEEMFLWILLN